MTSPVQREQIARLVDPKVFADAEAFPKVLKTKRYARAFEAADAILSLKEEEKVGDHLPDVGKMVSGDWKLVPRSELEEVYHFLRGSFSVSAQTLAAKIAAMLSSSPKGMEPVAWDRLSARLFDCLADSDGEPREATIDVTDAADILGWVRALYVSPVEGRVSRDHDQSTTDGQGNPTLAASDAVLTAEAIASWRRDPNVVTATHNFGRAGPPYIDLATKLAEWACDFEAAAKDAPTRLQGTVLMTRAAECRDAIHSLKAGRLRDGTGRDPSPPVIEGESSRDAIPLPTKKEGQ